MKWICIPSTEFIRGMRPDAHPYVEYIDGPEHAVHVDGFQIGDTPVTVGEWRVFIQRTNYDWTRWDELSIVSPTDDHPVVFVSWHDAESFCRWYESEFKIYVRLPTEAEWEVACRGANGQLFPVLEPRGEFDVLRWWDRLSQGNRPVREESLHASACGCLGMWENIGEWCFDWFVDAPLNPLERSNPRGPLSGLKRSVRGGCPEDSGCPLCAHRSGSEPGLRHQRLGFRLAQGIRFD